MSTELDSKEIHIWRVTFLHTETIVSQSEIDRSKNYHSPELANIFLHSRSAVRRISSLYTGKNPLSFQIELSPKGKPFFANCPDIFFNISHSQTTLAVAFSRNEIGFDIENIHRHRSSSAIAKRFFTKQEIELCDRENQVSPDMFLRIWTAKEAMLKLSGTGISGGLNSAVYLNESSGQLNEIPIFMHRVQWGDYLGCAASFHPKKSVKLMEI
jgi:4'-phosphopantetheinyl transferase